MELITFKPDHLKHLELGEFDNRSVAGQLERIRHIPGVALTGIHDDVVIGCGGVFPSDRDGTCKVWTLLSERARREFPLFLHAVARRGMRALGDDSSVRRLEASVHPAFDAAHRWVKKLGFHETGTMRHPLTNEIYTVYAYEWF